MKSVTINFIENYVRVIQKLMFKGEIKVGEGKINSVDIGWDYNPISTAKSINVNISIHDLKPTVEKSDYTGTKILKRKISNMEINKGFTSSTKTLDPTFFIEIY